MTDNQLKPTQAEPVTLANCPIGLFMAGDELCLKTEYGNNEGRIDAYIVSSGEFFWGSAPQTIANQRMQMVIPVDADELLRLSQSGNAERESGEPFQVEVGRWMLECFGEEIAADRIERADRFIEEALELSQTVPGFTVERARALVEYVFARPVGEMGQEVGGVGVTLAALCNTFGIDIGAEWKREIARVWTKVEAIRAKQATKPVGSALPVPASGAGIEQEAPSTGGADV